MQAVIRSSREQVDSDVLDADSPINEVEEAFERTTLSISRDKLVKGKTKIFFFVVNSCFFHCLHYESFTSFSF